MRKQKEYDINVVIAELKTLYENELIKGFIEGKRFDLLLGYASTNKGAVINRDRIRFFREDTTGRSGTLRPYIDKTTDNLVNIYDAYCKREKVEPNLNWQAEALNYVSPKFLMKFQEIENMLLEKAPVWDLIAFAEHIPHVNLDKIEERLIKEGSSLQLLAYAMDVKHSNKDKIRKALYDICMRDKSPESKVNSETKQLHVEHYLQFRNMFGSGKKQTERE